MNFSEPRLPVLRWLVASKGVVTPEDRQRLMAAMFLRSASLVSAASFELAVAITGFHQHRQWLFLGWIITSASLLALRLALLAYSRWAASRGRTTPTDAYILSGIVWAAVLGGGTLICDLSADTALQVLANVCCTAIIGGIVARNATTPRLALVQILVIMAALGPGVLLAPQYWMRMMLIGAPIYTLSLAANCFRLNGELVALIIARRENAQLARRDSLTGLNNRMFVAETMAALAAPGIAPPVGLIAIDLDGFKAINDALGHAAGDRVLIETGRRLTEVCGAGALITRLGGDEFLIVAADAAPSQVEAMARRVGAAIKEPFAVADAPSVRINASMGVAFWPRDGANGDAALIAADKALYAVKRSGRADYAVYDPLIHSGEADLMLFRSDLEAAINGDFAQLELHYQAVTRLSDDCVSGREALVRWRHPQRGLVSPAEFIPVAEASGLIIPLGEWVVRRACLDAANWANPVRVAVNVSPVQLRNDHLAAVIKDALADAHLSADRLEVEVTETVLLSDDVITVRNMERLRAMGIDVVLDDFGTGFSSLSNLCRFPFNRIKIDGSFVRDALQRADCAAVVRATVGLARDLGVPTTAECIETAEQLAFVRACGCSDVQGFLLGRPEPAAAIARSRQAASPTIRTAA